MSGLRSKKSAIVILNGISPRKKHFYQEYLPALSKIFDVEVHETQTKHDARRLASQLREQASDVILAAGGDGTLNQVVNGVLEGGAAQVNLPTLGVIPMGSGNDFVRGAGIRSKVSDIIRLLGNYRPRPIDIGIVEYSTTPGSPAEQTSSYFVNVADIGMGPEVVGRVLSSSRAFGNEVAYYKSILNTFLTYKPMVVRAVSPEWTWEGKLRTLAVANGKYYGHGLCIAPDALVDDGMFSVFICGNVSVFDFIMHTGTLKSGKNVNIDDVLYKTARAVEFTSDDPCPIEADGELLGWLPAKVRMIEKQLNFLI